MTIQISRKLQKIRNEERREERGKKGIRRRIEGREKGERVEWREGEARENRRKGERGEGKRRKRGWGKLRLIKDRLMLQKRHVIADRD